MPVTLPYGSWPSPVSTDLITSATVGLEGGCVDGDDVYWVESHASQRGRASLWRLGADGSRTELTPDHNVRSSVHEYGGGAFSVASGVAVFVDFASQRVFVIEDGRPPRPITPEGSLLRYGGLVVAPGQRCVYAVREDHTLSDIDCVNTLVRLDLDADNADGGAVVASGADFYSQPAVSDDDRLAWFEWDHPDMPWDATRLVVAEADGSETVVVAGGPGESAIFPAWAPDGSLLFCSDRRGWWNLHRWNGSHVEALHDDPYDCCNAPWLLGAAPYSVLDDGRVVATLWVDGLPRPGVVADGAFSPLAFEATSLSYGGTGSRTVARIGRAAAPLELAVVDWTDGSRTTLRTSWDSDLAVVSVAEAITWDGPEGPVHAWWYPPAGLDTVAPHDELPPVIVRSHGGPTGFSSADLNLTNQFWTSRGIAVLDVNYGGSSHFGRAYRERLRGRWGLVDVRDCIDAVRVVVDRGLADPTRIAIMGGSAGGYTTLQALVSSTLFGAGLSDYGISDLATLATDTHKFEAHYTDGLVAPWPEGKAVYEERSPIHHLDRLSSPMLLQQGLDDRVVPPNQAREMAAAVRAKGLPVALVLYEGEGHGFRRADTIAASLDAKLSFLGQVFGFVPAGDVPVLAVDNLDAWRATTATGTDRLPG
ncbi:MAG TPA: prolyl oligopeptidase family serine peptidase [Propionibacteriaceae bacterium]|nr:prolyl oligopeptidase family serine peptidase [Propionibacteriaceae bacterium]